MRISLHILFEDEWTGAGNIAPVFSINLTQLTRTNAGVVAVAEPVHPLCIILTELKHHCVPIARVNVLDVVKISRDALRTLIDQVVTEHHIFGFEQTRLHHARSIGKQGITAKIDDQR